MKTFVLPTPHAGLDVIQNIKLHCPKIMSCQLMSSIDELLTAISDAPPDLVFVDATFYFDQDHKLAIALQQLGLPTILMSPMPDLAVSAVKHDLCGYLLLPIETEELVAAVAMASHRKAKRTIEMTIPPAQSSLERCERIGIPTIDGFNFFSPQQIIRCEGYHNCTRIITVDKTDIVSSYNIGVFRKKLQQFHFFSPHKSHLINLAHMTKFHKEGTITMSDNSCVPISKRKKSNFLKLVTPAR